MSSYDFVGIKCIQSRKKKKCKPKKAELKIEIKFVCQIYVFQLDKFGNKNSIPTKLSNILIGKYFELLPKFSKYS